MQHVQIAVLKIRSELEIHRAIPLKCLWKRGKGSLIFDSVCGLCLVVCPFNVCNIP